MPPLPNLLDPLGRYQGKATTLARTLIEALTGQRDLYIQLAALARRQSDHIATGDAEALMTVLSARAVIIEQLTPLDTILQPYKDKWDSVLNDLSPADRSTVSALLTQVRQLLADILAQDDADQKSLIRQKESVSAQISQTVTGAQLNRAYGTKPRTISAAYGG